MRLPLHRAHRPSNPTIMIVQPELYLQRLLRHSVVKVGCRFLCSESAHHALSLLAMTDVNLVLMDALLPDMSGRDLCRAVRTSSEVPIIVMSSVIETDSVVDMLNAGADEYISKPFCFEVLEAYMVAHMRRELMLTETSVESRICEEKLRVVNSNNKVWIGDRSIVLTNKELDTLCCLMATPDRLVSTKFLCRRVWGDISSQSANSVRNIIRCLRRKLEADPRNPNIIRSIHGRGYMFVQTSLVP